MSAFSRSRSLRNVLTLAACAALLAGCPTGGDGDSETEAGTNDEGGTPVVEGGPGTDGSSSADASKADSGPPPPACSRLTTLCPDGQKCAGAPDCVSKFCFEGLCKQPAPADGVKNGDETDVDCGGSKAPACADTKGCLVKGDCTSGVCTSKICQAPTATDGVQNGDETGVDCGGTTTSAPKCLAGSGCLTNADCDKIKCDTVQKKCLPAAHDDGIKNLDETGIDCGGPTAGVARCAVGEGCAVTSDCNNVKCNAGTLVCDPPTSIDDIKNGTETDVDCGGGAPTNAPGCTFDKACSVDADCASGGCSAAAGKKCEPRSCVTAETAGITSCGAKETGDAAAVHDSCCKSLVLPTRTTKRLDKYEITSGRYRTFLGKTGPNVRAWVTTYIAANPTSQLATLVNLGPNVFPDGSNVSTIYPASDRFDPHSLTAHTEVDIDNYGGIRGCYNGTGDSSANTYWNDATHQADFGLPPRQLARSISDEKPLNCAMPMMFAAFCAWDGGELATLADYRDAWVATYPWGAADTKRPNYNWCNGTYNNGGFTCQCDGIHNIGASCPAGGFSTNGQPGVFYEWPLNTNRANDNEPLIAAPGRLVNDATALQSGGESWYDLYANLAEYTGDFAASSQDWCDFSVTPLAGDPTCTRGNHAGTGTRYVKIPTAGIIGQTWEGHTYNRGSTGAFPVTFQYGKFGGRCVRPATPF